jgi:hypothetical protein
MCNVFTTARGKYFYEVTKKERRDDAITGTLWKYLPGDKDLVKKSGSFRIEGNGTVTRGPKFLKDAAKNAKPVYPLGVGPGGLRDPGLGSDGKPMFELI